MYRALKQINQWEHLTLTWDDGRDAEFVDGEDVRVLWPNGERTDHPLRMERMERELQDMGHRETVVSFVPHIETEVRGLPVFVPLHKLKVWR